MVIFITTASILVIAAVARVLNKFMNVRICPICAGVSGTWVWMLVGIFSGQLSVASYQLPIALLMGGSVVGIAYQLEKKLPDGKSPILWKTLFIPTGFIAVYGILVPPRSIFFAAAALIVLAVFLFFLPLNSADPDRKKIRELEKKMKNCC